MISARYSLGKTLKDGILALTCFLFLGLCLFVSNVGLWLDLLLGTGVLLFLWQLIRLARRHGSEVRWNEDRIELLGADRVRRTLDWADLAGFTLRYYSTRRDRSNGWMDLTLTGSQGTQIRLDSDLEQFERLVDFAWRAAKAANISPNSATHDNLKALGLLPEDG